MTRLNLALLLVLIVCALNVITARHLARQHYADLQKEQKFAHDLDVEYGKLQLEQSTWAAHSLIERRATEQLGMHMPEPREIQVLGAAAGER